MTRTPMSDAASLSLMVRDWAERDPDRIVGYDADTTLTYQDLDARIETFAAAVQNAGLRAGDRIAALLPPSFDFLISFLGAERAGGVWVGLNPKYTPAEINHVIVETQPRLILFPSRHDDTPAALSNWLSQGCDFPVEAVSTVESSAFKLADADPSASHPPGHISLFVFTSGTTGAAKAAMVKTEAMAIAARRRAEAWDLSEVSLPHYLPVNHIGGASDIIGPVLATGGRVSFHDRFDPERICEDIDQRRLSVLAGVPAALQKCAPVFKRHDLSSLQLAVFSGGRAPEPLLKALSEIAPNTLTSYGMTESVASITISAKVRDARGLANTLGKPTLDFETRIDAPDETGAGELQVRGPTLTPGYWRDDAKTQEAFTEDGFYRTGDIIRISADGAFELVGRKSGMFKSGGYNIYPAEIESVLESVPGVVSAVIVGVEDPNYGEVGFAFVEIPDADVSLATLSATCRDRLANYKIPKQFFLTNELPALPNGKPDRRRLAKNARAQYVNATPS